MAQTNSTSIFSRKVFRALLFGILLFAARTAPAAGIFFEAGPGLFYSRNNSISLVRVQTETSTVFGAKSFYEGAYSSWSGKNSNDALSIARGVRMEGENTYATAALGAAHVRRTTETLGTPFQFYIRFSSGITVGPLDLSLGYIHYSNGKLIFRWNGPNNSENFMTFSIGARF